MRVWSFHPSSKIFKHQPIKGEKDSHQPINPIILITHRIRSVSQHRTLPKKKQGMGLLGNLKLRLLNGSSKSLSDASEESSKGRSRYRATNYKKAAAKPANTGLSHQWCEEQTQNIQVRSSTRVLDGRRSERSRKNPWFWELKNHKYRNARSICIQVVPMRAPPPSFWPLLQMLVNERAHDLWLPYLFLFLVSKGTWWEANTMYERNVVSDHSITMYDSSDLGLHSTCTLP